MPINHLSAWEGNGERLGRHLVFFLHKHYEIKWNMSFYRNSIQNRVIISVSIFINTVNIANASSAQWMNTHGNVTAFSTYAKHLYPSKGSFFKAGYFSSKQGLHLRKMVCALVVIYMHHFPLLCVACDTVPTAGLTEGAELGNETNCLHFLRVQPLRGTPMNITQLKRQQICDSGK